LVLKLGHEPYIVGMKGLSMPATLKGHVHFNLAKGDDDALFRAGEGGCGSDGAHG
jgi:hypothetical protein